MALALAPWAPRVVPAQDQAPAPRVQQGRVSWYGKQFAGRATASGELFSPDSMTMAHRTLPFGTRVKVTNLRNRRSVVLRVNDRGPVDTTRIGDVSEAAAKELGMWRRGLATAKLEVIGK